MSPFVIQQKIGFQHCDPAGIVFYPRYFEMFNAVVENWFEQRLGFSYYEIHMQRGEVVPTVYIEVDFKAPSRLGDTVDVGLTLQKVGRASIEFSVTISCADVTRVIAKLVLVYSKMDVLAAAGWPDDMRAALNTQLATADCQIRSNGELK